MRPSLFWKLNLLIIALFILLFAMQISSAAPIYITEGQSYTSWNGTTIKNQDLQAGTGNYPYLVTETNASWKFYTSDGNLTLPKAIFNDVVYTPDKISFNISATKSQFASKSVANGTGNRYFVIPKSYVNNRFIFDYSLPDVCVDVWGTCGNSNIFYSNISGQTRLNFNSAQYASLNASDIVTLAFHSYDVNASGTLNVDGGQYVLSQNISCASTCLTGSVSNFTLEMGNYTITNGMTANGSGILINSGKTNITITNGSIILGNVSNSGSYGIYFQTTTNSRISNVNISQEQRGILLAYSSNNNTLTNNTANSNTQYGILMDTSSNNTLTSNTANSNTQHGIYLATSSNNTLTNNTANSNTQYGIYMSSSSNNNTLTSNTANSNSLGIYLAISSNDTLTSNTALNNVGYAIRLYISNNSILTNNTGTSTTDGGLSLEGSYNNLLNLNTFYSLSLTSEDIALKTGSNRTNIFNTNWTVPRKIKFYTVGTEFNQTQNGINVITNSSIITQLNITQNSLTQQNVSSSINATVGTMLNITVSGLLPNTLYQKWNGSVNTQNLTTDSNGNLPVNTVNFTANVAQTLTFSVLPAASSPLIPGIGVGIAITAALIYYANRRRHR